MDNDQWLEISLRVNGELAEAVSEVLSRFAPNGVAVEAEVTGFTPDGQGIPSGLMKVSAYLPMDETLEQKRQTLEQALWYLSRIQPLPPPQFRTIQETDWSEAWKTHYHPIPIGKRLIIVPAWLENPIPARLAIRMDPGMAFGTGTHPSTQLCLEALEEYANRRQTSQSVSPFHMMDIGCGSGILSIAAVLLGSSRALAIDIDPLAVRTTRENALANGVEDKIEVGQGSVPEVLNGAFSFKSAPLVIANILAPVILELFQQGLSELVLPSGTLILAGILQEQAPEIEQALTAHRFNHINRLQSADWVALTAIR
ncbi:MAG: 50S ribosomal protein L11 methyltransferase [Chloroflexota bacterium]